uniref:Butyrophilin like 2 n=1 Tax=Equus caballus TaxID=9796 RepID=A0A9L0S140_HORSE
MEVRWVRSHRYPAVYVYMDGDYVDGEQMAEYRGRTALVSDAIHEGRLTLQIHNARTSDDGQYRCLFEKDGVYQEANLDLKIVEFKMTFSWKMLLLLGLLLAGAAGLIR